MKKVKDVSVKQPITIASVIVGTVASVIIVMIMIFGFRSFMYNMSMKQLAVYATVCFIVALAIGSNFIIVENMTKDNTKRNVMACIIICIFGCMACSFGCAGNFVGNAAAVVVYAIYYILTAILYAGLLIVLMCISALVSIGLFGCTIRSEENMNEENIQETQDVC